MRQFKQRKISQQYEVGRKAYERGCRFDWRADPEWQRGFKNARDSGAISGRPRVVVGDGDPARARASASANSSGGSGMEGHGS